MFCVACEIEVCTYSGNDPRDYSRETNSFIPHFWSSNGQFSCV